MKKMLMLINPNSGRSTLYTQLATVVDIFCRANYEPTVVITQNDKHLADSVTRNYAKNDIIVACGGDGTLNLTINALCKYDNPPMLGYIPCGTTNDFAKTRGISLDPVQAASQIAEGSVHNVDLGFFGDKPYIYIAAFGTFSEVSYETPRQMKQNLGHAAYVFEGIKSFVKSKSSYIKFNIDGVSCEGEFIYGMLTNTNRVGGFELPIMNDFSLDDGLVDITLIKKPETADDTTKLLNALVFQQPDNRIVYQFRASKLEYESESEIPWTLDGEFGGAFSSQIVTMRKHFLKMVY